MSVEFEPLDEGKFPRSIAKRVNEIAAFVTQRTEVQVSEDLSPKSGRVEQSRDRKVIVVPRGGSGNGIGEAYPFRPYFRFHSGAWQRGIYALSPVQPEEDGDSIVYPAGLLNNNDWRKATAGWVSTADNDLIWDKITFDPASNPTAPFTIVGHQIFSTSGGSSFPAGGEAEYADISGGGSPAYAQTALRIRLARIGFSDTRPYVKVSYTRTNMRIISAEITAVLSGGGSPRDLVGVYFTA